MSTQPSSRFRPSTLGTSRRFVRYILGAGSSSFHFLAVPLMAFASAAPIFSPCELMSVLQVLFLSTKSPINLMRHHEIVGIDTHAAAGIHHFVGRRRQRHRRTE